MYIGRRVRAYTRLLEAAKALTTRDYVRGISGPSTLFNSYSSRQEGYRGGSSGSDNNNCKTTLTDDKRLAVQAYYNYCKHTHIRASNNYYFTFLYKATNK
jgi:hypothetical protein